MKKLLQCLLILTGLSLCSITVHAYDFEADGIYYNITDSTNYTVEVTNGDVTYSNDIIIPENVSYLGQIYTVKSIAHRAFGSSYITSVTIPNSVEKIGMQAFVACKELTSVILPETLETIAYGLFGVCPKLNSITLPETLKSIEYGGFQKCTGLTSIIFPNSLKTIDNTAFLNCTGLTQLQLPDSLSQLGSRAFSGCTGLTSVEFPNSLKSIDDEAFSLCTGLSSITIPEAVTNLGKSIFANCSNLTTVNFNATDCTGGSNPFDGCDLLSEFNIGDNVTTFPSILRGCNSITEITVPEQITKISSDAFQDCNSLLTVNYNAIAANLDHSMIRGSINATTIKFGEKVSFIPWFHGWSNLTSVTISKSVTAISPMAFYDCYNLTEIIVDSENQIFDSREDCNAVINTSSNTLIKGCKNSIIPNSISSIFPAAFAYTNLVHITIPESVTEIGEIAFCGCYNLSSITLLNPTPPTFGINGIKYDNVNILCNIFYGVPDNCQINVPAGSKEAYSAATVWKDFTNIVEFATASVSTQENSATFEIPTTDGAVTYTVNVYSDEAKTQLITSTDYDTTGKIIPSSTSLELSIDGLDDGTYYYDVVVKSKNGEILNNYSGTFEIDSSGIDNVGFDAGIHEIGRYDINGRRITHPSNGINIIRMSDGSIRKELVR